MPTNKEAYSRIKNALFSAGFPEAEAEAREIVCHFAHCGYSELVLKFNEEAAFDADGIISQRLTGKPVAYILNKKYFYGLPFYVDERVLIPRYDTETLVFEALNIIKENGSKRVLDMCCGSGCIGIAIAENACIELTMADISPGAAEIAERNAALNRIKNAVVIVSDFFEKINGEFDVISANPPYVTEQEYSALDRQVRNFEPKNALVGGTMYYKRLADEAWAHISDGGYMIVETGCFQAKEVADIFKSKGYDGVRCVKDIARRDRVIICTKNLNR